MEEKKKKKFPVWVIILIIIGGIVVIGALGSNSDENSTQQTTTKNNESKSEPKYQLDKAFKFDDLEITIGSQIEFTTVSNQFSEENGKDVIKMPITVKNLKNETHNLNMFYFKLFGSQGTELKNVSAYFEDSVDLAGELRPESSYTKYLYFLYDGDGKYAIEFDNFSDKIEIEFNVSK